MNILGMGNALVDVLVRVEKESILEELGLPKGSMQLVDETRLQAIENRIDGFERVLVSGGSAANTIHGLAELGVPTGFIGSAGMDAWGEFYINDLKAKGIVPVFYRPDKPTGRAMALLTPDSERTFGTYLGAAIELTPKFLFPELFTGWTVFHIEGYLVQNHDLIESALILAKKAGCMVSLDLASYNVVEDNLVFLKSVVPQYVDILFANQEEALAFTGKEPEAAVKELATMCSIAIVKTGKDGAWVQSGNERYHVKGLEANCIDTTGAGDLFASGFLYGYTKGFSLKKCGELGNLLAASVIEVTGPKISEAHWVTIRRQIEV
ncbi:MAG: adenosine kinase [Bacteroidales bacterium]|jgi:sugar/nucleoside kinase (ribokinase family)